jgi:hypothetical protein
MQKVRKRGGGKKDDREVGETKDKGREGKDREKRRGRQGGEGGRAEREAGWR